jgi:transcriptional antiterminator RfaH
VSETFWSVVQTRPQQEALALRNLERQHYTIFYPFYYKKSKRGKEYPVPVFPTYMFVYLDEETYWAPINHTYGVKRLLTYQNGDVYREPHQIGETMIESLRALRLCPDEPEITNGIAKRDEIPVGTVCIVKRGPLVMQTGIVEMSSTNRIALLLEVFSGKSVRVNFSRDDIEILAPERIDI